MSAPVALSVDLAPNHDGGFVLRNPIMIASGTFGKKGYGEGQTDFPLGKLGAVLPKTLTLCGREGNDPPHIFPTPFESVVETEFHLLNSYGLNNPGIRFAMSNLAPKWASMDANIVLSIAAHEPEHWEQIASFTRGVDGFAAIELNLSCPNVQDGAMFSHRACHTATAVAGVRQQTDLPIWAKLSPNVPDITEIAKAAVEAGADALTISNTMPAMRINVDSREMHLGAGYGGLSGSALRPISLALVHKTSQVVDVPVIGVGGIASGRHVVEYLLAGASAVQIGSANRADFNAPFRILDELETLLAEWEISELSEIIGTAKFPKL